MSTGFGQITRMLERSLNSQERSRQNRQIEYIQVDDDNNEDELDKQDNEKYIPEKDLHLLQETAQKQYNKKHRKEIKNEIKILIRSAKINEIPIDYTKKFGEIAPQLEKDLIPYIQSLLEQCGIHATLSIVRDVFSDLHKNGRCKWKESQLNEAEIKQKKIMSHIINRLSEKRERRMKGALAMKNHPDYRKSFKKCGIKDINEILNKNEYHSPEESDLENDPNASTDRKNLFVYKLSWRSDELTNLLHSIDEYVEKYFPENKRVRPLHKSIDEESDDESESESEEEEQSQQSQQSYGLNVDKLDINAESDEEEEGEDEKTSQQTRSSKRISKNKKSTNKNNEALDELQEVIDNMRDQSKKTNKKSSSKPSSQEQEHIHDNVPKRTSKEKEKEQ
ncbi:unnamed protein product [Rhizophagus irregularis]|nr:unnamed protein product [Rhizophagus irregularis]CAB5376241.1 unnamed protein product [Rhizophagus irregularis]